MPPQPEVIDLTLDSDDEAAEPVAVVVAERDLQLEDPAEEQRDAPDGLDPLDLGPEVTKAMNLELEEYAQNPEALDDRPIQRALKGVLEFRAMRDLQKGLRVTMPNLEQTGLVRVTYPSVERLAAMDDAWVDALRGHFRMSST